LTIRAIILDFDGLILDTESPLHASWMEVFEQHGLDMEQEQWASLLGSKADVPEAYAILEQHLGRRLDREKLHQTRIARELRLLEQETVLTGVRELIEEAQTTGLSLAVASSSDHAWVDGLLAKHNLIEFFDHVVCAEDVAQAKPAPDLFLKALSLLCVEPHQAIVFEDSEHGVRAAKTAGIFCVAVPNKITRCLTFADADLIVSSVADHSLGEYVTWAESS